eukprot:6212317-Pleurochrysis_carterae.AAC.1
MSQAKLVHSGAEWESRLPEASKPSAKERRLARRLRTTEAEDTEGLGQRSKHAKHSDTSRGDERMMHSVRVKGSYASFNKYTTGNTTCYT